MFRWIEPKSLLPTIIVIAALGTSGCAQLGHTGGHGTALREPPAAEADIVLASHDTSSGPPCADRGGADWEPQIERGCPNKVVDGIGWFFGIPEKILLWDRRAENHNVSDRTVSVVQNYLFDNGHVDVKVRVNQYDPGGEWKRLVTNKAVHPGWRYTVGAWSTLGYTLLPGRLLGGDNYNPFTNTVSIYSDIPSMAVHEAAYATDNRNHEYRGTYGFGQQIAGVNIWHETHATKLAHQWLQNCASGDLVAESNRILPPLYGIRVAGSIGEIIPQADTMLTIAGAATGHVVGHRLNRKRPTAVVLSSDNATNIKLVRYVDDGVDDGAAKPDHGR